MSHTLWRFHRMAAISALLIFAVAGCSSAPTEESAMETTTQEQEAVTVTLYTPGSDHAAYLNLLGKVEAENQVGVFPATSGQIAKVNVQEGESVRKGDILFVLSGAGGVEHPAVTQYKIAQENYDTAHKSYNNAVLSAESAIQMAELQLQSARHQAQGAYMDYSGLSKDVQTLQNSIGLIRSSLGETQLKNQRDLENLLDAMDDLKDERRDAILDLEEQIDNAPDESARDQLESQLDALKDEMDKQIEQLEDQFKTLQSGAVLAENQLLGQLQQVYGQEHSLLAAQASTQAKLGLYDGLSDPLLLAEQGADAARVQASWALTQAKAQLDISAIHLQSAADQQKLLLVMAPAGGVIGDISAHEGDTISPQIRLTEIVETERFVLIVDVDIENVSRLTAGDIVEVKIGGKYVKTPIRSIALQADARSRLVPVTLELPRISFRPNQTLEARLPIISDNGSLHIPLDSVTISSDRQFVYIARDGKAYLRTIKLGAINGDVVEVLEGLDPGDQIILEGARRVSEGQPITIQ